MAKEIEGQKQVLTERDRLSLKQEFDSLTRAVIDAEEKQLWWEQTLAKGEMSSLLEGFERESEAIVKELLDCEPKELVKLQADVRARRDLVARMWAKAELHNVEEAQRKLREFRERYPLFLSAVDPRSAEAKTA